MSPYTSLLENYTAKARTLNQRLRALSFVRLFLFAAFIYCGYKSMRTGDTLFIAGTVVFFIAFLLIVRLYDKLEGITAFYKALVRINKDEIAFLSGEPSMYASGGEYANPHHPYSYDLDIFGERGLYAYLNRCSTAFGRDALAQNLLHPDTTAIKQRQEAIAELSGKIEFRQHLQAYGSMHETKDKELRDLKAWIQSPVGFTNKALYYSLLLFPLVTVGSLVYYFVTGNDKGADLFYVLFVVNLIISFAFGRKIAAHLSVSTSVNKLLQQYAGQLKLIEQEKFESPLLQAWQQRITTQQGTASKSIGTLASLFNYLETVVNLLVSILLNGIVQFHVHVLYKLERWKEQNGNKIFDWLQLLGDMEALNSFANLAHNNPDFCTPELSATETLSADNMGHLLIRKEKRVTNSVSFAGEKFMILTGSNMSGKSTFLRTLGVNLLLARSGSMVCATRFVFYPYDVYVSMRITDSLQDSESFFYAELKRLETIIAHLEAGNKTFILLDEILRGTNSNDKRNGTIGLIRKLQRMQACGIIATHDVVVADLIQEYPGYISNNCFESEIVNDELLFDYKLKQGVCTKLSASFLMKKLGVID
ncbi:DNA mismatch repair protein MutS [Terrimonas rubra]|uniref:DNA mismatch repair protein MutS n=1 Tax=Terrimonas rubra TaxID=1035890 RepID=A0ABW6A179_9BACT